MSDRAEGWMVLCTAGAIALILLVVFCIYYNNALGVF